MPTPAYYLQKERDTANIGRLYQTSNPEPQYRVASKQTSILLLIKRGKGQQDIYILLLILRPIKQYSYLSELNTVERLVFTLVCTIFYLFLSLVQLS